MNKDKPLRIRKSTAEFLIFTRQAGEEGIEVHVADEPVWLTQKLMAALFDVTVPTVSDHLANLFEQGEIVAGATVRKFRSVHTEGAREVGRNVDFYNLDAIIAVGHGPQLAPGEPAAEHLTFVAASSQGGVEKVFTDSELREASVIRTFRMTAAEGPSYLPSKGDKA